MTVRITRTRMTITAELEQSILHALMYSTDTMTAIAKSHGVALSTVSRINKGYNSDGTKVNDLKEHPAEHLPEHLPEHPAEHPAEHLPELRS